MSEVRYLIDDCQLSVIAQADEFRDIRLKPGEKSLYKEINKANGIKFPIKTDINLSAHKITLLIQSELGAVELPSGEQFQKHRLSFQQDKSLVFSHINRIIRCIIDCQLAHGDSVSARHALELSRSLGAKAWDDSVLQLKQIDQIGIVAVRKFASAGITNMEQLEAAEPIRIETVLSRNPPFGMKLLARVAEFPKPRVSLKEVGKVSTSMPYMNVICYANELSKLRRILSQEKLHESNSEQTLDLSTRNPLFISKSGRFMCAF